MDTFSIDKVTAYIILDTRRAKKNKKYPVKYRICYGRKCIYYPSGRSLSIDEFADLDDPSKMKKERKFISGGFERIKTTITDVLKSEEGFSLDLLSRRLSRGTKDSVYVTYQTKIDELKQQNKLGTSEWYLYSKKSLEGFAGDELKFNQVTISFLQKYEMHLIEKKKTFTTISMYMRALQAIINIGKKGGIIGQSQYPFGKDKYEIPNETTRKLALKLSQIKQILDYPLKDSMYRDIWIFIYLASGINVVDLLKLKYSNIENGRISYYRQKTIHSKKKKKISVVMLPKMKEIIDTWGNSDNKPNNYIFPVLNDNLPAEEERRKVKNFTHLLNDKMTDIGKALGIGKITTYTGRHSFATISKRSGVSTAYISEALGHADVGITETYLDTFEDDEMVKNAEKLLNF